MGQGFNCGDLIHTSHLRLPGRHLLGGHVPARVLGKVVATHKPPVTHRTDELLLTCVCSSMPGEFIRAGEFLIASFPVAAKRFLTWKRNLHVMLYLSRQFIIKSLGLT